MFVLTEFSFRFFRRKSLQLISLLIYIRTKLQTLIALICKCFTTEKQILVLTYLCKLRY